MCHKASDIVGKTLIDPLIVQSHHHHQHGSVQVDDVTDRPDAVKRWGRHESAHDGRGHNNVGQVNKNITKKTNYYSGRGGGVPIVSILAFYFDNL